MKLVLALLLALVLSMTPELAFPSAPGGVVQLALVGDKALLMPYVADARRDLAQMKDYYGVDAKRAAGEWVGFHHATKRYDRGVSARLIVNGLQDSIILTGEQHHEEEEHERKPRDEPMPYLWVGARIQYEKTTNVPYGAFGLVVIEPGDNAIVATHDQNWSSAQDRYYYPPLYAGALAFDLAKQDIEVGTYYQNTPAHRRQYNIEQWDLSGSARMRFTRHGLRHYSIQSTVDNTDGIAIKGPHDPLGSEEQLAERFFPSDYPAAWRNYLWDQVVVLDPDEGGMMPTSHRAGDREVLDFLASHTGISGRAMVLGGAYAIKLVALGPSCRWSQSGQWWREQFTGYYDPLPVEVEVRVGKFPYMVTQRFEITIDRYAEEPFHLYPFGTPATNVCTGAYDGANPHSPAWWQGAILADPTALAIGVQDDYAPAPIFAPRAHNFDALCALTPLDIYIEAVAPYAGLDPASVYDNVADELWQFLQNAADGDYGGPFDIAETNYDELEAAAQAVVDDFGLWRYDPVAKSFHAVVWDDEWQDTYRYDTYYLCRSFGQVLVGKGGDGVVLPNAFTDPSELYNPYIAFINGGGCCPQP